MNSYSITLTDGYIPFPPATIEAEPASKAKYKLWLKSACDAGYWDSFFDFCRYSRVKLLNKGVDMW
jgi:hypothetical protein